MTKPGSDSSSPMPQASAGSTRAARKSHGRSRVTNCRDVLPDVDGRSIVARRFRDIVSAMIADYGGADQCSEARIQLIRRFAAAAVLAEQMEAALARGLSINVQQHALLCSTLVRVARQIGIKRVPRSVTPALADYLELKAKQESDQ
jgi:hypothetical protein